MHQPAQLAFPVQLEHFPTSLSDRQRNSSLNDLPTCRSVGGISQWSAKTGITLTVGEFLHLLIAVQISSEEHFSFFPLDQKS